MTVTIALKILQKYKVQDYEFLSEGREGFVFVNGTYAYKVFKNKVDNKSICLLVEELEKFKKFKFLPTIFNLENIDGYYVLVYKYIEGERPNLITKNESFNFLIECWKQKVIFKNIKLENFIKDKDNNLWFIDISLNGDIQPYDDNLFLNMAVRFFIDIHYTDTLDEREIKLLKRSSINNFKIPELEGFQNYLNELFNRIIYSETEVIKEFYKSNTTDLILEISSIDDLLNHIKDLNFNTLEILFTPLKQLNLEQLFWKLLRCNIRVESIEPINLFLDENGYHKPKLYRVKLQRLQPTQEKVSLLIKTCPQDSKTIYQQVKHILKQLLSPNSFYEKVIAIDKKESNFLRQYTDEGCLEELYSEVHRLIKEGLIDYIIELPETEIEDVNYRWFRLRTEETHTITNIPVTPQLYAFEQVKGDYILQMDSDVLIGREDYNHSFLKDMLDALHKNPNATSVGFNIPKDKSVTFVEYHAPKGEYKPEVRFALIDKKRFYNSRPWSNELVNNKLKLSWYQALHQHQKNTHWVSLRGGNPKSYYTHPQNYRKQCEYVLFTILDRIEQNIIPEVQREGFDVEGNFYDWCLPKRNEEIVIITCLKDVSYERFLRTWNSILSQSFKNFGWIIIDDASENGINILIENLIKKFNIERRVTFIKNRFRKGILFNTYFAIHYFVNNPDTTIVIIDGDDALVSHDTLIEVYKTYKNGADATVGKMYRTDKLFNHYPYMPNFISPRLYGGNVWQHMRTFKKYLFDSINIHDFMHQFKNTKQKFTPLDKRPWFEHCADFAYMIPITEMADNPQFIEKYNYFHERTIYNTPAIREKKDKIIEEILKKPKYTPKDKLTSWRRDFIPNRKKIEIDITYECNLKCLGCNRSCTQAPSKDDQIEIDQIKKFIEESIALNHQWELINILGGEPTLHPKFIEIVELLLKEYIWPYSPKTTLQITSNGYTKETRELLNQVSQYKNVVIDKLSFKNDRNIIYFTPFNIAPIDLKEFKNAEFYKGCWVTSYCGIGLNKYGYYACAVAGGIDRVMGKNLGVQHLKEITLEKLKKHLDTFCKYCGNFVEYDINRGNFIPRCEKASFKENKMTQSWVEIYHHQE